MTDEKIFSKYFEHLYNGHRETIDMLVDDALANSKSYKQARNWIARQGSKGFANDPAVTRLLIMADTEAWNDILNEAQKRITSLALSQQIEEQEND